MRRTYFMIFLLLINICLVHCKGGRGSSGSRGSSRGSSGSKKSSTSSSSRVKPGVSFGWHNPTIVGPGYKNTYNQPSSNIGHGGYPIQEGTPIRPQFSGTHNYILTKGHERIVLRTQPKKTVSNNHFGSPPAYTPSQYGFSSSYYPQKNHIGYPGGFYGNSRPSYGGMGLFSSGTNGYGYSGGGNWGSHPSYASKSGTGSISKGLLIGAAGGYLAGSLVNRLSNPWSYNGYGYGYNYYDRYRQYDRRPESVPTTVPPPPVVPRVWKGCIESDPATNETLFNPNCTCYESLLMPNYVLNLTVHDCFPITQVDVPQPIAPVTGGNPALSSNGILGTGETSGVNNTVNSTALEGTNNSTILWKGCFGVDPSTYETVINPNCSCTVSVTTSPDTGLNVTTQDCTPKMQLEISQQSASVNEANKPAADTSGDHIGQPVNPAETSTPKSEPRVGDSIAHKRMEFYSQLEKIVNMGHFAR